MQQLNHQIKCCHTCGGSTSSDEGPIASRRTTMKEMIEMLIQIFSQVLGPSPELGSSSSSEGNFDSIHILRAMFDVLMIRKLQKLLTMPQVKDLICTVVGGHVSESIQPIMDKLLAIEHHRRSEAETTSVRTLQFVFLDGVSGPVLTGKEIKSEEDKPIRVALIDKKTGNVVDSGSESSLRAEIVLLDATDDNDENNWTSEDFLSRIIKEGNKKEPHFSKTQYVDLKEGVGFLCDIKLGHDKSWTKNSKCKLGVRLAGNVRGVEAQEAWTETFTVCDSRGKLYEKGNPPRLSDPLWKLENIGRDGDPIKRLEKNNVKTVKDFLFLHSIDPMRLQKIILGERLKAKEAASIPKWNAIVKHAKTCRVDEDTDIYVHFPQSESQTGVVFDVVGGLKGLVDKSHYIRIDNLSEDNKNVARELLLSAFENQNDITSFRDETSLLERFPHPLNHFNFCECDPSTSRFGVGDFSIDQEFLHDFGSSPGSMQPYEQNLRYPTLNQSPSYSYNSQNWDSYVLWNFDDENETSCLSAEGCNPSQYQWTRQLSIHGQEIEGYRLILLLRSVRKFKEGNRHPAQKKRRIH